MPVSNIRILIVSEPGVDGVFRHVEDLVKYMLATNGLQVDLAYSSCRGSDRLYKLVDKVQHAGGIAVDLKVRNRPCISDFTALKHLRSVVLSRSPSVIHAHSSKAGGLVRLLGFCITPPIIYTPHAYYGMGENTGVKNSLYNGVERILGPRGTTIHVSPEEAEFAHKRLHLQNSKSVTIPNAVDFTLFRPAENEDERAVIRESLGIPANALVIGSIGRVSYQKNPSALYEAFARFQKKVGIPNLKLLHVGSGEDSDLSALVKLAKNLGIENCVVRPSYRSDPEVFYRAMDAFCLSSRYEGLPFTALEALASNLPLILSEAPGLRSFGSDDYGFNSVYYGKQGSPDYLAEAMCRWYERRSNTVNHRAQAKEIFSIPKVYGQILDLYRQYAG